VCPRGMTRIQPLCALLALAGLALPAVALAAPPLQVERVPLAQPSAAPPSEVARGYLAGAPPILRGVDPRTLTQSVAAPMATGGELVVFRQEHAGLPIVGAVATVRVDREGRVRWSAARVADVPDDLDTTPRLSPGVAVARAAASVAGRADGRAELVIYASPAGAPRLAYEVRLAPDPRRHAANRAYVDAETGFVYRAENLIVHAAPHANVFEVSPVVTPELSVAPLALAPDAELLDNEALVGLSCVDHGECVETDFGYSYRTCSIEPTAFAGEDGHFTHYTFESHTDPEDPFSEVQAFYHANKALARAVELGGFELAWTPLQVVANYRMGDYGECSSTTQPSPLLPFDNAFFSPYGVDFFAWDADDAAPAIVMGQGTLADFAYDGEVVYHEFGHAVMFSISPELSFGFVDEYGWNPTPGGLHEGFADLMSVFVTGSPLIGEYAGQALRDLYGEFLEEGEAIRNVANDARCPDRLIGQSHHDSAAFTGAVWEARELFAGDPETLELFEAAVFGAQRGLGAFGHYGDAVQLILLELEWTLLVHEYLVGPPPASVDEVAEVFERRGVLDCARVVDAAGGIAEQMLVGAYVFFDDTQDVHVPGPMQVRYQLEEPAERIVVDVEELFDYFFDDPELADLFEVRVDVVLKAGEEPIRWKATGSRYAADYEASAELERPGGPTDSRARAVLEGPFPAGTYHLMFVNRGIDTAVFGVSFDHDEAEPVPGTDEVSSGGCGCRASSGPAAGWLALLGLALVWRLRGRPGRRARRTR
jgi:MYXO-CTERM domain-containing protein